MTPYLQDDEEMGMGDLFEFDENEEPFHDMGAWARPLTEQERQEDLFLMSASQHRSHYYAYHEDISSAGQGFASGFDVQDEAYEQSFSVSENHYAASAPPSSARMSLGVPHQVPHSPRCQRESEGYYTGEVTVPRAPHFQSTIQRGLTSGTGYTVEQGYAAYPQAQSFPQLDHPWPSHTFDVSSDIGRPSAVYTSPAAQSTQANHPPVQHVCEHANCGRVFQRMPDLNHHARVHRPYNLRPYVCDGCAKRFLFRKDLKRHLLVHEDPQLQCPHCGGMFQRPDHLKRHQVNCRGGAAMSRSSSSRSRAYSGSSSALPIRSRTNTASSGGFPNTNAFPNVATPLTSPNSTSSYQSLPYRAAAPAAVQGGQLHDQSQWPPEYRRHDVPTPIPIPWTRNIRYDDSYDDSYTAEQWRNQEDLG